MTNISIDPPGKFRATRTLVYEGEHQWLREMLDRRGVKGTYVVGPRGQIREALTPQIEPIAEPSHEEWVAGLFHILEQAPRGAMLEAIEKFTALEPEDGA